MICILLTGLSSKKNIYQNFPYAIKYNSVINQLCLIQFILPMNVTCCICFRLLCSKGDDYVSSTLFSCLIWIAVWTLVVLKDSIYEHISTSIWCGMMILSVLYLCYSIWRVWKCSERYYESNGASV